MYTNAPDIFTITFVQLCANMEKNIRHIEGDPFYCIARSIGAKAMLRYAIKH